MSTASDNKTLTRIRDNQRRSRAKRKLYVQDLEARLRQCKLQAIEASTEVQVAARRVEDENHKLRALLAHLKIVDNTVDEHLQSSSTNDTWTPSRYGSYRAATSVLDQALQTRRTCCSERALSAPENMGMGVAGSQETEHCSAGHSNSPLLVDSIHREDRRYSDLQPASNAASSTRQSMIPSSSGSQTSDIGLGYNSSYVVRSYPRLIPALLAGDPNLTNNSSYDPQMFDFSTRPFADSFKFTDSDDHFSLESPSGAHLAQCTTDVYRTM